MVIDRTTLSSILNKLFLSFTIANILTPSFASVAQENIISITAEIISTKGVPSGIRGSAKLELKPEHKCVYIPNADPNYRIAKKINQQMKMLRHRTTQGDTLKPATSLIAPPKNLIQIFPHLWMIKEPRHETIHLEFTTPISIDPFGNPKISAIFVDDFIPIPSRTCDDEMVRKFRPTDLNFTGKFINNSNHELIANLSPDQTVSQPKISLALIKGLKKYQYEINGIKVSLHLRNTDLESLRPTLKSSLISLINWLGPPPTNQLAIIESQELESFLMPGIVPINKPRQSLFQALQTEWLNWSHWALTTLMTYQWFIPQILQTQDDDLWFFLGLVDFLTSQVLAENTIRSNLFNAFDLDISILSMTYRGSQNITAALLEKYEPFALLTDENLATARNFDQQHPLLYIRHSMALRHLATLTSHKSLQRFLRKFMQDTKATAFRPAMFYHAISKSPSPFSGLKRKQLATTLLTWWTKSGWPDYALGSIKTSQLSGGKWLSEITVKCEGDFQFPVIVEVIDDSGQRKRTLAKKFSENSYQTTIITPFEPQEFTVDPDRDIYDRDRFNNSNEAMNIEFFPGSATTLKDDHYTTVWLPYIQRRPGEDFSAGIHTMLFRYIQGEMTMRFESQADGKLGFFLQKKDKIPQYGLGLELFVGQGFDSFRESKVMVSRSPLFPSIGYFSLALKARERRIVGEPQTSHGTFAIAASFQNGPQQRGCQLELQGESEQAPRAWSAGFSYERTTTSLQTYCPLPWSIGFANQLFWGKIKTKGDVASNVFFRPENLGEAHIRLDQKDAPIGDEIWAVSSDIFLPFFVPLPNNSLILSKQMKWRLFYDYGEVKALSEQAADNTKWLPLASAGGGFMMPFGGDFIGGGSLALTRISLLVIAHTRIAGEIDSKASILFDLYGEL